MMYWIKIILITVFAFALSISSNGKNADCCNIADTYEITESLCADEDSYFLSSDIFYAGRTLSHLLKTRRINASAAFCFSVTSSKDNHNSKFILPVINIQNHYTSVSKFITGRVFYINPHSRMALPKSYYIFTLGKIII